MELDGVSLPHRPPQMPTRVISCTFKYYTSFNVPKCLSYLLREDEQGSNEFLITQHLSTARWSRGGGTDAPVGTWFVYEETLFYVNKKREWRSIGMGEAHLAESAPLNVEDDPEGDETDQEEVDADLVDEVED